MRFTTAEGERLVNATSDCDRAITALRGIDGIPADSVDRLVYTLHGDADLQNVFDEAFRDGCNYELDDLNLLLRGAQLTVQHSGEASAYDHEARHRMSEVRQHGYSANLSGASGHPGVSSADREGFATDLDETLAAIASRHMNGLFAEIVRSAAGSAAGDDTAAAVNTFLDEVLQASFESLATTLNEVHTALQTPLSHEHTAAR